MLSGSPALDFKRTWSPFQLLLVGLALVLARVPYLFMLHIQEDSYITWRCAKQLADTGVYGFNPGERVSAATSHLYSFFCALQRLLFGDAFIPVIIACNIAMLVAGVYLLARSLFDDRRSVLLWVFAALTPVALNISYAGMETSLLILLLGLAMFGLARDRLVWWVLLPYAALPWVRPDAISIQLILLFAFGLRNRKVILPLGIAAAAGVSLLALFNWAYFGSVLNQTIIAKNLNNLASHRLGDIASRIVGAFFTTESTDSVLVPIRTKYLMKASPLFALPLLFSFWIWIRRAWQDARLTGPALSMVLIAVGPIIAFAIAGAMAHPWYFWPSVLMAYLLLIAWVLDAAARGSATLRRDVYGLLAGATLALGVGQWALSVNWCAQERLYRASIGEYIKGIGAPEDTLLLEPAGHIPYFSGLRTWDEVGLVAPEITGYQRRDRDRWWVRFIQDQRPTFILEREPIRAQQAPLGGHVSDADRAWLESHYELVREFHYEPDQLLSNDLLREIAHLGTASPYFLYRRRPG